MNYWDVNPEVGRLVEEIRNDRTHGASQLARQALGVLKSAAEHSKAADARSFLLEQETVAEKLALVRPAMAPLRNIVSRYQESLSKKVKPSDLASVKSLALSLADELTNELLQAVAKISAYASELISPDDKIMTHSYSSTVIAVLKKAFDKGKKIEVITTGEVIARELGACGLAVTFIDDSAIGRYISAMDKVMVGADRVCADGSLINGVGTYPLALVAKEARVPFYVLCETLKFDPGTKSSNADLEGKEIPAFDITPLELITAIITEDGLLAGKEVVGSLKKL